jgi:hypothetical protein
MKTRKQKISKSERIPKLGSPTREVMLKKLTEFDDYKNEIDKGLRFFTRDELECIENRFIEGMTWDDIESELSAKGTMLKHSTFRKYIQDGIIPKAKSHKSTDKGRVAVYEPNIIRHLNFVNFFYKVTNVPRIDELIELIGACEISYLDAIESVQGWNGDIYVEMIHEMITGNGVVTNAIKNTLSCRDDKSKVLEMYYNIQIKFEKTIQKDINELINYLESHKMLITQIPSDEPKVSGEV